MNNKEIWKDIPGYEGSYQVSNYGRVKRLEHIAPNNIRLSEKISTQFKNQNGYMIVILSKNGEGKKFQVHRLVAQAFLPNPNNLPFVNHKDESRIHNNVENLEWCTAKYNSNYGTIKDRKSKNMTKAWAKKKEDGYKVITKRTVYLTYIGETHTIPEWSEMLGIEADTIRTRYYVGWNINDIFETPAVDRKTVDITKKFNVKCCHCCYWDTETGVCDLSKQKKTKLQKCNEFTWTQKILDMYKRKLEIETRINAL
jgi:hypothetical protein